MNKVSVCVWRCSVLNEFLHLSRILIKFLYLWATDSNQSKSISIWFILLFEEFRRKRQSTKNNFDLLVLFITIYVIFLVSRISEITGRLNNCQFKTKSVTSSQKCQLRIICFIQTAIRRNYSANQYDLRILIMNRQCNLFDPFIHWVYNEKQNRKTIKQHIKCAKTL